MTQINNIGRTIAKQERMQRQFTIDEQTYNDVLQRTYDAGRMSGISTDLLQRTYDAGRMSGISTGITATKAIERGMSVSEVKEMLKLPFLCDNCGCVVLNDEKLCIICK